MAPEDKEAAAAEVSDAIRKSASLTNTKDKCPFKVELDSILGTRSTSSPVEVVESSPALTSRASTDVPIGTENFLESS